MYWKKIYQLKMCFRLILPTGKIEDAVIWTYAMHEWQKNSQSIKDEIGR
jgi:hypothetical protein